MAIACGVSIVILVGLVICLWCKLHEQAVEIHTLKGAVELRDETASELRRDSTSWRLACNQYRDRLKEIGDLAKGTMKLHN
jgi:uncharacterized membrane protein YraQ (UPF0718 family)